MCHRTSLDLRTDCQHKNRLVSQHPTDLTIIASSTLHESVKLSDYNIGHNVTNVVCAKSSGFLFIFCSPYSHLRPTKVTSELKAGTLVLNLMILKVGDNQIGERQFIQSPCTLFQCTWDTNLESIR